MTPDRNISGPKRPTIEISRCRNDLGPRCPGAELFLEQNANRPKRPSTTTHNRIVPGRKVEDQMSLVRNVQGQTCHGA